MYIENINLSVAISSNGLNFIKKRAKNGRFFSQKKGKQVRNLCVYSRPGDRVWPCAMNKVTGQIDSTQLTSDRCQQSASVQPAVVEWTDRLDVTKGPSSSLLPYTANVKLTARLSALAVRKMWQMISNYQSLSKFERYFIWIDPIDKYSRFTFIESKLFVCM